MEKSRRVPIRKPMMHIRIVVAALSGMAGLALSAPAGAADFAVTIGTVRAVPCNNHVKTKLAGIGPVECADTGASVAITGPVPVAGAPLGFAFVARKAGFNNKFRTGQLNLRLRAANLLV